MKNKIILFFACISLMACNHSQNLKQKENTIYWYSDRTIMNESFNGCVKEYISCCKSIHKNNLYYIHLIFFNSIYSIFEIDYCREFDFKNFYPPSGYYIFNNNIILIYTGFESLQSQYWQNTQYKTVVYSLGSVGSSESYIIIDKKTGTSELTGIFPNPEKIWDWPIEVPAKIKEP